MTDIPPLETPVRPSNRRDFVKKAVAVVIGSMITVIPGLAGLLAFLDPLRRKGRGASFIKIATLEALPSDGIPRKFQVLADRTDAWNKYLNVPLGAVYVRRDGDKVTAFNATCPHLGCFVDTAADGTFRCPCHNSAFKFDGSLISGSVSPRGLDELEVDQAALKQGAIAVKFQAFQAGKEEKIARV